jgi:nucleotide-binding universal stress UspA family protein
MGTPQHLLVATDFSDPSLRAMELASTFRQRLGARVDVVYVHLDPFGDYQQMPRESMWDDSKELEAYLLGLRLLLEKDVAVYFGPGATDVAIHVLRGRPVDKILGLAAEIGADLICVGTTGKNAVERALVGSVAHKLMRTSAIPLLTVH